ncbi:glycoside hydrolase [Phaffia rhodozyma]|uniref:Glycoside hydrolase n=1 Tax=Phaffia rhodozyma TaxID=264483 RepID=A0A0F7SHS2_PHARH|nr:glycoside hydrolase [Phaffia rhodozyma]
MTPPATHSPVTSEPIPDYYLHSSSAFFRDTAGRHLLLRGINLSGASKSPLSQPSQCLDDLWDKAENGGESFVGQPLRLDDGSADIHLARLRGWGFNVLRYVVTWESIEHEGPGKYDEEFMDYTVEVLRKCKEYGFLVYMDPHQDCWSRFSGGSGAPYWTLIACGLNPRNFTKTSAAFIHAEYPDADNPDPAKLPAMIWGTNVYRFVSQTVFTLFFGGRDFAPLCIIDGQNIQDYLQSHYQAAIYKLASRIKDAGDLLEVCVVGWDSLNEPSEGLIGYEDISVIPKSQTLKLGPTPTAFQGMRLAMGEAVTVESWKFTAMGPKRDGSVLLDPQGVTCWLDPAAEVGGSKWGWKRDPGWTLGSCIWALHGVWDPVTSTLFKKDYFQAIPSNPHRQISFISDFWRPAWSNYAKRIRQAHPEAIHFVQPPVFHRPPVLDEEDLAGRACASCHWYDGLTLMTRHWNWFNADALGVMRGQYKTILQAIKIGESNIRKSFQEQLGVLKQDTFDVLGQYPTLIGECGIPYDLDNKKAYGYGPDGEGKGDFSNQQKALDATLNAADGNNVLNYTIWTYVPDNSHEWGDNWNLEDLSLWSSDDTNAAYDKYQNQGGVIKGDIRPYNSAIPSFSKTNLPSVSTSSLSLPSEFSASPASQPTLFESRESSLLPPDLLINGARAVGAFSRPYPVATTGVPTDVSFDIKSSTFKLTVEMDDHEIMSQTAPTEIYLPWVHYASDRRFIPGSSQSVSGMSMSSECDPKTNERHFDDFAIFESSSNSSGSAFGPRTNLAGSTAFLSNQAKETTRRLPPFELDVEVHISEGRYEIQGQILRWWYNADETSSTSVPDTSGKKTFMITVKRNGGALKTLGRPEDGTVALSFWNMIITWVMYWVHNLGYVFKRLFS